MTELIRSWLLGISCAAMVLSLAECIAPEGTVKRICRLSGGLVLMLAAIGPLVKLDEADLTHITESYQNGVQEYKEELESKYDFFYESIIEENTAAYILDKADELGMTCGVTVTVAWDQAGVPRPQSVNIRGNWTQEQRWKMSKLIEMDLGIPEALQYFEETD